MADVEKGHSERIGAGTNGAQAGGAAQHANMIGHYGPEGTNGPFYAGLPGHTPFPTQIGNPGGLGLFSFASTTFILSLYNVNTRDITTPNVVVGMALFTGGLAQLLAGMWEFPRGNQFGGTAFTSYGAFWMSYAIILIPGTGIAEAYTNKQEFNNAVGIYLSTWFIFTMLMTFAALRRNITFIFLLFSLALAFLMLAIGSFTGAHAATVAGGAFGIIAAVIAYYAGLSELLIRPESYFMIPMGTLPRRQD